MTVMTLNLVEKQPAAMRRIIGKHLAVPRWQETCDYYNQMADIVLNSTQASFCTEYRVVTGGSDE